MLGSPQALSLLRQQHTFPGPFVFKVIGANTAEFAEQAGSAIARVVGHQAPAPKARLSAQGSHQALTFTVDTTCAEQVVAVFAALRDAPGTAWVL